MMPQRADPERNADYHTGNAVRSQEISPNSREIAIFIGDLQNYSNLKLFHPAELETLLRAADARGLRRMLMDAAFHAKFAVKTRDLVKRIGPGADGFEKLSSECQSSIERSIELLRAIIKEEHEPAKSLFVEKFFAVDRGSLADLFQLFSDLAWMKNWEIDGKEIPIHELTPGVQRG